MTRYLVNGLVVAVAFAGAFPTLAVDDFERYQIILERKPFGEAPPEPLAPPPPPGPEKPPWTESYRLFSVIHPEDKPIQASLWDLKSKKAVMVTVGGDPVDGIELISANITDEVAVLSKDGEEATLELKESTQKSAPKPQKRKKLPRGVKQAKKPATPTGGQTAAQVADTDATDRRQRIMRARK